MNKNARRKQLYQDGLLRWANTKLTNHTIASTWNLVADDGAALCELLNRLSDGDFTPYRTRKTFIRTRSASWTETDWCRHFLVSEGVWVTRKSTLKVDLHEGNENLLDFIADLMLHFCVRCPLRANKRCKQEARQLLRKWINRTLPDGTSVCGFTSDWKDGRALGALLNGIASDLCPKWSQWDTENCVVNLTQAMDTAQKHLIGIDKLLDPIDMCYGDIMDINIIAYLSQFLSARLGKHHNYRKVVQYPVDLHYEVIPADGTHMYQVNEEADTQSMMSDDAATDAAMDKTNAPKPPERCSTRTDRYKNRTLPSVPQNPIRSTDSSVSASRTSISSSNTTLKYVNLDEDKVDSANMRAVRLMAETIPKVVDTTSPNFYTKEPSQDMLELRGPTSAKTRQLNAVTSVIRDGAGRNDNGCHGVNNIVGDTDDARSDDHGYHGYDDTSIGHCNCCRNNVDTVSANIQTDDKPVRKTQEIQTEAIEVKSAMVQVEEDDVIPEPRHYAQHIPAHCDLAHSGPAHCDLAHSGPAHSDLAHFGPEHSELAHNVYPHYNPAHDGDAHYKHAGFVKIDPVQPASVDPARGSTYSDGAYPMPAPRAHAQVSTAHSAPTHSPRIHVSDAHPTAAQSTAAHRTHPHVSAEHSAPGRFAHARQHIYTPGSDRLPYSRQSSVPGRTRNDSGLPDHGSFDDFESNGAGQEDEVRANNNHVPSEKKNNEPPLEGVLSKLPIEVRNTFDKYWDKDIFLHSTGTIVFKGSGGVYHRRRCKLENKWTLRSQEWGMFLTKSSSGDLSEERMKKLLEEAQTRTMFNHNHIMELVAIAWWQGELVTIMPRVDFGTVQQYVTKHKQTLDWADKLVIGLGVASAMEHVTNLDFVLQNVTTDTCMVNSEKVAKLVDLSEVTEVNHGESISYKGDIGDNYKRLPTEVFREKTYSVSADVWMFGVFLWRLFCADEEPYGDSDVYMVLGTVSKGERLPKPDNMAPEVYKFLLECWSENPGERPIFPDVCSKIQAFLVAGPEYRDFYNRYRTRVPLEAGQPLTRNQSYCSIPNDKPSDDEDTPALPPRVRVRNATDTNTIRPVRQVLVELEQTNQTPTRALSADAILIRQNLPDTLTKGAQRKHRYSNVTIEPDTSERQPKTVTW